MSANVDRKIQGYQERMKTLARAQERYSDEQGMIAGALGKVLPTMFFVIQSDDPGEAKMLLSLDVGRAVGADIDLENAKLSPASKND